MQSSSEKSVKLPMFDGVPKNFQIWWMRFIAFATVYKFNKAISKDALDPDMPVSEAEVLDETKDEDKKKIVVKNRNSVAMANLTMAFTNETTMGLVYKAETKEWPGGLAHLVIKGLFKKYQPVDTVTLVELRQMLNKITMKKGSDPVTLFEQIAAVEHCYNTGGRKIAEDKLIAVVLNKSTMEYKAVLSAEQRVKGMMCTLEDLESAMNQHWRQIGGHEEAERSNEISLAAVNFNGVCFKCGKKGHKASVCPDNNKGDKAGSDKEGQGSKQKEKRKCF